MYSQKLNLRKWLNCSLLHLFLVFSFDNSEKGWFIFIYVAIQKFDIYTYANFSLQEVDDILNLQAWLPSSASRLLISAFSYRRKTSFLFLWSREELVEEDRFPVDTAAAYIDGHIPHTSDPPVIVVHHQHWLSVGHQHLGLHLLAVVKFRTSTLFSRAVAQNLGNCFWKRNNN